MSKENIKRFPSLRNNIKLDANEESIKPISSELKVNPNLESDLSKKIQNKLRMRKKSSNAQSTALYSDTKTLNEFAQIQTTSIDSGKNLQQNGKNNKGIRFYFGEDINLKQLANKVWDTDESLIEKTMSPLINRGVLKQMILVNWQIIICQLSRGEKIENILGEKGQKIIRNLIIKKKIEEREKSILSLISQRVQQLQNIGAY